MTIKINIKMFGKFFIFSFICVSLAQVQDDVLQKAIEEGLLKVKDFNENGQIRIQASLKEVTSKSKLIELKTSAFVAKSVRIQDEARQALRSTAQATEEKAKETNKPPSVFECIKKVEENANKQIETYTNRFKTDMERLKQVKLANIKTQSTPLQEMEETLRTRYEKAVNMIENCKDVRCVDTAVNSFSSWLDLLVADIERILRQVTTVLGNFQRDASNYFNNSNMQITRIKSTSLQNIKNCIYKRETIFEEY